MGPNTLIQGRMQKGPEHAGVINGIVPGSCHAPESHQQVTELAPGEGRGTVSVVSPRKGIRLILQDYSLAAPLVSSVSGCDLPLKFNYCISGKCRAVINEYRRPLTINPGECSFFSFSGPFSGKMSREAVHPVKMATLFLDPRILRSSFNHERFTVPPDLKNMLEKRCRTEVKGSLTSRMRLILDDLFTMRDRGPVSLLLIEARVLELVSCQVGEILRSHASPLINGLEAERVLLARDVLVKNMDAPPTLSELARTAGVSHTKLIQLFRLMYGTTPFGFLRDLRLERGKELLESGETSVTDVAYSVGYNCMSFFAKAFREKFGLSPSDVQRKRKNSGKF